jgi:hypothetical protein
MEVSAGRDSVIASEARQSRVSFIPDSFCKSKSKNWIATSPSATLRSRLKASPRNDGVKRFSGSVIARLEKAWQSMFLKSCFIKFWIASGFALAMTVRSL